jgi:hypothetical protein
MRPPAVAALDAAAFGTATAADASRAPSAARRILDDGRIEPTGPNTGKRPTKAAWAVVLRSEMLARLA